jgi:predicted ribonuclease YlaK
VLRNGSKSALATYRRGDDAFHRIEKLTCYGITPRNAEQSFALKALMILARLQLALVAKSLVKQSFSVVLLLVVRSPANRV